MRILFYFGHPSQYLFLRPVIRLLRDHGHETVLAAKTKDVLTLLLDADGEAYHNLLPEGRGASRAGILFGLWQRERRMWRLVKDTRPDLLVGSDPSLAHVGRALGLPVVTTTEDDYQVIRSLAWLTFPFTSVVLSPTVCSAGPWERKKTGYRGYQKLSYLHPAVFTPDRARVPVSGPFVLIRLASLTAHHDFGATGLQAGDIRNLIALITASGRTPVISSEGRVRDEFAPWLLRLPPADMHHCLAAADLLVSDSQSMSVEAAMLGTPSVRFSGFAGRISVLEELEHTYGLTFGVPTGSPELLSETVARLLATPDLHTLFAGRRERMLYETIRVGRFVTWFLENFPLSRQVMREFPAFQHLVSKGSVPPRTPPLPPRGRFDFSDGNYRALLYNLLHAGYAVVPFAGWLAERPAGKCLILRQDIDARKGHALKTALLQHALGIRSTFYFRVVPQSYDPRVIDRIAALGHEIGYHYEDMDLAYRALRRQGKKALREEDLYETAIGLFTRHLEMLRRHYPVTTICMHGSPLSPFDNRALWKKYDYRDFGLTGEPYFDIDFSDIAYLTDTGRSWHGERYSVRDRVIRPAELDETSGTGRGTKKLGYHSTPDIIEALQSGTFPARAMMTFHPQRWSGNAFDWSRELVMQRAKNVVKRAWYVER